MFSGGGVIFFFFIFWKYKFIGRYDKKMKQINKKAS